ncbi:MAG: anti-sigma F factor [Peptococcaceae bacterium]|nr:anti-sigma F factor [Peptococcaceae bacterium]
MDNWFELRIPALSQNVQFARAVVAQFALEAGDWSLVELNEIRTAVSEAVTNAIIHGYHEGSGDILLRGMVSPGSILVVISDFGVGIIDVEEARQPLFTTRPDEERCGLGFTVMESFMDEVEVESTPGQGTIVKMTKYLSFSVKQ